MSLMLVRWESLGEIPDSLFSGEVVRGLLVVR